MTWKIHTIELSGSEPHTHLVDPKVHLHLEVYTLDREAEVYIGSANPETARLHVLITADCITVERAEGHTKRDCAIIDSVLETLGRRRHERQRVMGPCYATAKMSLREDS